MQKIPEGLNGSLSSNPYKPLGRNPLGRESRRCAERPKSRSHLAIDTARGWRRAALAPPFLRDARDDGAVRLTPSAFLRLLAARLHLAISLGPALAGGLLAAFDGQRIVGHVLGDDRARTDIGALADLHRGHQRGVGADERALADQRLVLGKAVIVAGDGAGAEVGIGADMGVADIGEMIDLGAGLDRRGLGLDEVADS